MTAPGTTVELRGLTKSYDGTQVVADLDLVVRPGSLTALLGPSGCGKTTTLKVVAGLLDADAGDVLFDGRSVLSLRAEHPEPGAVRRVVEALSLGIALTPGPAPRLIARLATANGEVELA